MNRFSPKDVVRSGLCIGCGICVSQAKIPGTRMQFDAFGLLKPYGPDEWYSRPSEEFSTICPFSPIAKNEDQLSADSFHEASHRNNFIGSFETNYVGHVTEEYYRMQGSSGGMVSWVALELLRTGLIDGVAHVVPTKPDLNGRYFQYRISRTPEEIFEGARSRYYPVELSGIIRIIKDQPGHYAIVAVPCMIKGIQLLRQNDPVLKERIVFTLGLFCGHMKSARFAESIAWQMKIRMPDVKQIEYRYKYPDRPANWYNASLTLNNGQEVHLDWWHMVDGDWGAGFFMSHACNYCDDVVAETADISFGDAWVEPYSSDGKGVNVVIVRSPVLKNILSEGIRNGKLRLEEVPAEIVIQTQAAGFRQRREGLAYRLTWSKRGIRPVKRVSSDCLHISKSRKLIYRMRYLISVWSHRMFLLARKTKTSWIYLFWARVVASVYYGIAYHHGNIVRIRKRFLNLRK